VHTLYDFQVIYESVIGLTGINPKECITVGDSLHHDIKGANTAGIQSAFITGGIHADELNLSSFGETATPDAVHSLCTKFDAYPDFVLPAFIW
jgi:ribonucleotide monophosphatase NagD (HAD superfamily)